MFILQNNLLWKKMGNLPKIVCFLSFTKFSNTNMRQHFFLKNFFCIPSKETKETHATKKNSHNQTYI